MSGEVRVRLADVPDGLATRVGGGPYGICIARLGDDFRLAAVTRSGIDLPDVQRPPDQRPNLLCCLR